MIYRVVILCAIGLISSLTFLSCEQKASPQDIAAFMDMHLAKRLEKIKVEKMKDCLATIEKDASTYVDSIIVHEFEINLLDSIELVEKPFKPQRPTYIRIIDTSEIKPIF